MNANCTHGFLVLLHHGRPNYDLESFIFGKFVNI